MRNYIGKILLVGAGSMSVDYVKIFRALKIDFDVVGRGKGSAEEFELKTGAPVIQGGLDNFLQNGNIAIDTYSGVIVATGVEALYENAKSLLLFGMTNILVEKPGGLSKKEIISLNDLSEERKANLFIAYNRRFYASTLKAIELIHSDGGVTSFHFEFTEWAHKIAPIVKGEGVKENWFLSNSSHVSDLAFYLGGKPTTYNCYTAGSLDWHTSSSVFAGAGITEKGALFSYNANWEAPGRWAAEFMTRNFRFIFKPLEQLQIIRKGQVELESIALDDKYDKEFKPGLFLQVKAFLDQNYSSLCTIYEQASLVDVYCEMANYKD
jgi:predicted dehydrogenase